MKQLFSLVFFLIISISLSAQITSLPIEKKWKFIDAEEFGVKYAATDAQLNDFIDFKNDRKFSGLINGLTIEGIWSEKLGKYTLTPTKEKSLFKVNWIKVISVDDKSLQLTYQSEDLIKTLLMYSIAQ